MRAAEHFVNARAPKRLTVRQVMENDVYTVSLDTKGITIAKTMTNGNFGTVPVGEKDFTLASLVSEFDLLRVMEEEKDLRQITAEEIMTRNVVTATEEMLVKDLIHLVGVLETTHSPRRLRRTRRLYCGWWAFDER